VIPAEDYDSFDLSSRFEECIKFIDEQRKCTNVLVHCYAGVSRSATITIAYIMKTSSKKFENAFEEVKKRRICISPNEGFIDQLKDFEKIIFPKSK
jgi:protein-tyrosine phosphatase